MQVDFWLAGSPIHVTRVDAPVFPADRVGPGLEVVSPTPLALQNMLQGFALKHSTGDKLTAVDQHGLSFEVFLLLCISFFKIMISFRCLLCWTGKFLNFRWHFLSFIYHTPQFSGFPSLLGAAQAFIFPLLASCISFLIFPSSPEIQIWPGITLFKDFSGFLLLRKQRYIFFGWKPSKSSVYHLFGCKHTWSCVLALLFINCGSLS